MFPADMSTYIAQHSDFLYSLEDAYPDHLPAIIMGQRVCRKIDCKEKLPVDKGVLHTSDKVVDFVGKIAVLSDEIRKNKEDLNSIKSFSEQALKAKDQASFKPFSSLPHDVCQRLYKGVWIKDGYPTERNYGGKKYRDNPLVITTPCPAILYPEGGNLLEQHLNWFSLSHDIANAKLIYRQLQVLISALNHTKDETTLSSYWQSLHDDLKQKILASPQIPALVTDMAKKEIASQHKFGELKIVDDIKILFSLPKDKCPVSMHTALETGNADSLKKIYDKLLQIEKNHLAGAVYHKYIEVRSQEILQSGAFLASDKAKKILPSFLRELRVPIFEKSGILRKNMLKVNPDFQKNLASFRTALASTFIETIFSSSTELKKLDGQLSALKGWHEAAKKAQTKDTFPSFDALPENIRENVYKAVWVKDGRKNKPNYGGEQCKTNPLLLAKSCTAILFPEGESLLSQVLIRYEKEIDLKREQLLHHQLNMFVTLITKVKDEGVIRYCFERLDQRIKESMDPLLRDLALKRAKQELHGKWGFGEEKIKGNISILFTLPKEKMPEALVTAYESKDKIKLEEAYKSLKPFEKDFLAGAVYESYINKRAEEIKNQSTFLLNDAVFNILDNLLNEKTDNFKSLKDAFIGTLKMLPEPMRGFSLVTTELALESFTKDLTPLIGEHPAVKACSHHLVAPLIKQLMARDCGDDANLLEDLLARRHALTSFVTYVGHISQKYSCIASELKDKDSLLKHLYDSLCLLCSTKVDLLSDEKWEVAFATLIEMQKEDLSPPDALFIFERALRLVQQSPLSIQLTDAIALRALRGKAAQDARAGQLHKASQSVYKPVYKVEIDGGRKAKFKKPDKGTPNCVINEIASYAIDQLCGIHITQPILKAGQNDLQHVLHQQVSLKKWLETNKKSSLRQLEHEQTTINDERISHLRKGTYSEAVQKSIEDRLETCASDIQTYKALSEKISQAIAHLDLTAKEHIVKKLTEHFQGQNFQGQNLGITKENLPYKWQENPALTCDVKVQLLERALADSKSKIFKGVIQLWIPGKIARAYEMLNVVGGGSKMRNMPKTAAHLHILSGIIKGSQDTSCGNAMFTLTEDESSIISIKEFDDERGLPQNMELTYKDFRLWQLGLPQANRTFDRSFMTLFLEETMGDRVKDYMTFSLSHMEKQGVSARHRIENIQHAFKTELTKRGPVTLTPRSLFFSLFGGQEQFTQEKQKSPQISDWEVFEHKLPKEFTAQLLPEGNAQKSKRMQASLDELYR